MPDPIVPLSFAAEAGERAKNRSLHVEIYVPHGLAPGEYHGTLDAERIGPGRRFIGVRSRDVALAGDTSGVGFLFAGSSELSCRR